MVISPLFATYSPTTIPVYRNILPISSQGIYVREDRTSLVIDATLWFSLEWAIGLLKRGAKHLAVYSRSGEGNTARQQQFEQLRKQYDADIAIFQVYSSSPKQTEAMLAEIRAEMPPLPGIIHNAMVLHGGYLINLDRKTFWQVLAHKSFGAWILYNETTAHVQSMFISHLSIIDV